MLVNPEILQKSQCKENRMSGNVTEVLAGFAASLQYDDLPAEVRDHCKNLLLDTLACAVAGHRGEETQQLAALASGLAQSDESSVIGGDRLSLAGATLLNGYLVTAVTMCDVHRSTMTHVTPEVMPPALAIAERDDLSGRDLLVAIAAGCEVTTRIGIGLDYPAFRARGFHGPGVLGPFGAAAAVGRLRGFDAETMAKAFGLAGSQAAGTFAAWGTPRSNSISAAVRSRACWPRCSPSRSSWRPANSSRPRTAASTTLTPTVDGPTRSRPISGGAGRWSRSPCGCGRRPR